MMHVDGRWTAEKGFQAMAAVQQEREVLDWEREAIDLKKQGLESKDIAVAVDKSAATVRKAIAKARERGDLPEDPLVSALSVEPGEQPASDVPPSDPYPGQTTVDDFTVTCEHGTPNADVCGECDSGVRDPLDDFTESCEHGVAILDECAECDPQDERDLSNVGHLDEDVDPLTRFRAEAGEAVGDMPPLTLPEPGEPEVAAPVMPGTRQMALDFGPNAAPIMQSTVTFKSEKWPSGHFGAGDIVTGTFTARIVSVPHKEAYDKASEEFRAKPMAYGALITEIDYEPVEGHD